MTRHEHADLVRKTAATSGCQAFFASRIDAARGGSQSAVAQLLEACRKYLLLAANRGVSCQLQAKLGGSDLVQETILEAHQNFDRFHGHSQLELLAWTGKILEHKLAHAKRRFQQTGKRDIDREIQIDRHDSNAAPLLPLAADVDSPSAVAIANEEAGNVKAAMSLLAADHRNVLLLRNWERLSFAEIGQRMDRSPEAAHKLWTRALLQLRKHLRQGCE